jgi:aminoglycoside 3-N-acetyltransferase
MRHRLALARFRDTAARRGLGAGAQVGILPAMTDARGARVLVTHDTLSRDLAALGVAPGMVVLAHVSLSSLGCVVGGEQTVVAALRSALGDSGTLVMPSQSWQLCDPAYLADPAVPKEWWPAIRDNLPVYDAATTPTRTMGVVAEYFRGLPDTRRSGHPHRSFAAAGANAARITARHDLASPVGDGSPLRAMYELGGHALLLGVGHDKSTTLHLAEDRSSYPSKQRVRNGAPLMVEGVRRWVEFEELRVLDHDFEAVAAAFAADTGHLRGGKVGRADACLVPQRPLVDYAARWFRQHRS